MLKSKYYTSNSQKHLSNKYIYIINFLILINLISINIILTIELHDPDILIFNRAKFKAGNFAKNKNGDLFIEYYSEDDYDKPASRLFYGKTKNEKELFSDHSSYTHEINIDFDETIDIFGYNYFDVYNSKNLFVSMRYEPNKENQYLFSINSYDYIVELHKFNNNINTAHYLWNFHDFFKLNEERYRFPYEINLIE